MYVIVTNLRTSIKPGSNTVNIGVLLSHLALVEDILGIERERAVTFEDSTVREVICKLKHLKFTSQTVLSYDFRCMCDV